MELKRPLDIRPKWWDYFLKIVRRMQSVSRQNEGYAVISLMAVVNADGNPVFYSSPRIVKLEPKRELFFDVLEENLSEDAMRQLLEIIVRYG